MNLQARIARLGIDREAIAWVSLPCHNTKIIGR